MAKLQAMLGTLWLDGGRPVVAIAGCEHGPNLRSFAVSNAQLAQHGNEKQMEAPAAHGTSLIAFAALTCVQLSFTSA
jgi:hypothetical protein